jgi:hypothetical protein
MMHLIEIDPSFPPGVREIRFSAGTVERGAPLKVSTEQLTLEMLLSPQCLVDRQTYGERLNLPARVPAL